MLDIDFTTNRYKAVTLPPNDEGYAYAVLTLDDEDDVVVFARAVTREEAEAICQECNNGRVVYGPGRGQLP